MGRPGNKSRVKMMRCLMKTKMIKEVDDDRRLGCGAASIFVQAWTLVGGLWPFASGELALQIIRSFQQGTMGTMGTMGTVGKKRCVFKGDVWVGGVVGVSCRNKV